MYRGNYSFSMPKPYTSLNMQKKFPEDIECIIKGSQNSSGSLYISNIEAAQNINTLKKFGIKAVLTCAKGYQLNHPTDLIPHYKYIAVVDHQGCDLSIHFNQAVDFIKDKLAKTNILVHCIAGVSRSVSMVIAYLIREQNMSYEEGYRFVKSKRRIISPNNGFILQLRQFQKIKRITPTKRIQVSPPPFKEQTKQKKNPVKTPTKAQTLTQGLKQFKSTQLTPKNTKVQQKTEKTIERYQSTQITTNKQKINELSPKPTGQRQYKYNTYYNSTKPFYTPDKLEQKDNHRQQILKKYNTYSKSPYTTSTHNYKTTSQRLINIDVTPNKELKEENKTITPKNNVTNTKDESSSRRDGYFQNMNKELNDKIQEIRKKYEKERQKLYQKYQTPERNAATPKKQGQKDNFDNYDLSRNYATIDTRKRAFVQQRKRYLDYSAQKDEKRNYDYKNYLQSNTTFHQKRSSFPDQSYQKIYMKKKFTNQGDSQQKSQYIFKRPDDIRRNVDINMANYTSYNRFEGYRNRNFNDYYSRVPSYGFRRY